MPGKTKGTASLDSLLAGYGGLPVGTSILIEEHGATDFSGALLRYYAAEGLVQGHRVHVLGVGDAWKHELPGVSDLKGAEPKTALTGNLAETPSSGREKMKIAWRYENMASATGRSSLKSTAGVGENALSPFCHTFDLTKRLAASSITGSLHAVPTISPLALESSHAASSVLNPFLVQLQRELESSAPTAVHRVVIPGLLSPASYPPASSQPAEILSFLRSLRRLLREHSRKLTAMIGLPVSLFPRSSGLTRWIELLSDGVIELIPLPPKPAGAEASAPKKEDERGQGILKVHSLPILHEAGGRDTVTSSVLEDLSFSLSSSKGLVIKPFSLPPLEDETLRETPPASASKDGMEF